MVTRTRTRTRKDRVQKKQKYHESDIDIILSRRLARRVVVVVAGGVVAKSTGPFVYSVTATGYGVTATMTTQMRKKRTHWQCEI